MTNKSGSNEPVVLYKDAKHECLMFPQLVSGDGIQANQFLITNNGHAAVIDPGGDLTYTPLSIEIGKRIDVKNLDYVFASHQDPDIISSLPRWLTHTNCKVVCSKLWERFLPHLISSFVSEKMERDLSSRIIGLPDKGGQLQLGDSVLNAIPAHFLHSVGNFQFYDPTSKVLFSGDMAASIGGDPRETIVDLQAHIPNMEGFHKRYMTSEKVCQLWANMVRNMDVQMIVPQHGAPLSGPAVNQFLDWISTLKCGIDLLTQTDYQDVS